MDLNHTHTTVSTGNQISTLSFNQTDIKTEKIETAQYHNLASLYDCVGMDNTLLTAIFQSRHQNVSILDSIAAKDDGGGGNNWSYKTCKTPVKLSPPTNQYPVFYRPDVLPTTNQPTVSKH